MPVPARFVRLQLRTTDVAAAGAFYASLLGAAPGEIVPLPAEAAARGAPPHWLGHLGVDDVERAAAAFVARGAHRLGPTRPVPGGGEVAILRDPGGSVVALASPPGEAAPSAAAAWHELASDDLARAAETYRDLLGWELGVRDDLGVHGVHQRFAWQPGGEAAGSMGATAGRPGVHPQWLVPLPLEPALGAVRAAGGVVVGPFALGGGERFAACDDPQGAAFGLRGP
jgi:predicted enzyme related to lactoylglutathione lyase